MKRPPIAGLPTTRPRCPGCDRKIKPVVRDIHQRVEDERGTRHELVGREFSGWNSYYEFCTLRCASRFAHAAFVAGFRVR